MRKDIYGFLGVLAFIGMLIVLIGKGYCEQQKYTVKPCISDSIAVRAAQTAGLGMAGENELDTEGMRMQVVYQLARRSIVKIAVKDAAGSGVIWNVDDEIVIVSNKHLLMKDVKAEVVFGNGETVEADVIGYSQQYDIGYVKISEEAVTCSILRDIYEAVPVLYETESETGKTEFLQKYAGKRILQLGALIDGNTANFSTGSIKGIEFIPVFNTNMLTTECFSKAGMSGGGVFDECGQFLGMISGGDVPEDAEKKEAEITYSIPPTLILAEYKLLLTPTLK